MRQRTPPWEWDQWANAASLIVTVGITVAVHFLSGCGRPVLPDPPKFIDSPLVQPIEVVRIVHDYGFLDYFAALFIFVGMAALVASFVPVLTYIIPRKAAAVSIVCGIGAIVARGALDKFLGPTLWLAFILLIAAGGLSLWPWFVALYRRGLLKTSRTLEDNGDPRAAAALRITAQPKRYRIKEARKALLATMTPPGVDPVPGSTFRSLEKPDHTLTHRE